MIRRVWALGLIGCLVGHGSAVASSVRMAAARVERPIIGLYERCELTIQVEGGPIANPYDDEEIAVTATFQPPRGSPITVGGFYYQPFERVRVNGQDVLKGVGMPVWKVRFTPRRMGRWSSTVFLTTPAGSQTMPGGTFDVIASSRQGFISVDRDRESLRFESGASFIPIGENLAWGPSAAPLGAYEQWFQKLSKQGANYIRVWLAPWSFRLETNTTGVGRYDQQRAWQLDALLEQSERFGLYWQLCLLDHGSFSQTQDPEWQHNPYNADVGGMCRLPNEFVTDPKAKSLFRRMLRYLVNRWGYSPQLASWELFNEGDLSEIQVKDLVPWTAEMSQYLRLIDVNRHLITTSFHQSAPEQVWRLATIDTIQLHLYDHRDFAALFCGPTIEGLRRAFRKPVMVGEFGWINEFVRRLDPYGIHVHDGIWSSMMGGAVGSALVWYWDLYIDPNGLERHFGPLARFWRDEPLDRRLQQLTVSWSDPDVIGAAVGTPARAALWVKNRAHNVDAYLAYRCELAKQRLRAARGQSARGAPVYPSRVVQGATVSIPGVDRLGRYRVEWWDPYRGKVLARSIERAKWSGTLTIDIPELAFDAAAKLVRLNWWERG